MENTDSSRLEHNKRIVRALYEDAVSSGHTGLLRELIAPEYPGGTAGLEAIVAELRAAFPDIRYTLEDVVAEGDRVAVRFRWTGTYRAPFRGFPPTGEKIENGGFAVYTLRHGRITGTAMETDRLGFLQQLGVVPSDAALRERAARRDSVIDVRRAPNGVYLIDTFTVPAAARAEFEAAMRRSREYIRTLDGFRGDAVFVRKQDTGAFDIATIAAWESADAMARAKERVDAFYRRIGFDRAASIARWGITLQRAICEAPVELQ